MATDQYNYANRPFKGKSLLDFPKNYTVIDIETTGLDFRHDDIIEIGALKIRDSKVIERFSTLIKPKEYHYIVDGQYIGSDEIENYKHINFKHYPKNYIDNFIVELTGITNEMLENAPYAENVISNFFDFIKGDILLGHNVNFDINFLYDLALDISEHKLDNDFVDFLRIARKLYPQLKSHRLTDVSQHLNINNDDMHRSIRDCEVVFDSFEYSRKYIADNNIDFLSLWKRRDSFYKAPDLRELVADTDDFDEEHLFFNKNVVFTGKLEKMPRTEAAQQVVNKGGICQNGVNKQTNYLILGNNDYCSSLKGGKSNKHKKVEKMMLDGFDIQIISENTFYDILDF